MIKSILVGGALLAAAFAHESITTNLTWSKEISRVLYQHCAGCHRPQGRAMSLLTYEDARPWAKAIRDEVLNHRMPPWDAVKGVGEFRDDPSLSQPEMDLLVNWVEGGAPEGNPIDLPPVPPAPPTQDASPPSKGKGIEVWEASKLGGAMPLTRPMTLSAITPLGPVELIALLPDQSVKRLLWIPTFRPLWNRTYVLRTPLRLPRGTKLVVYGAPVRVR